MNPKILIVRRDNIGDLICTLPLVTSIRKFFPNARIDILVNSYSAAVLERNPDISNVYIYTKAKHRAANETVFGVYWRRFVLTLSLRARRYDWVVLANVSCIPRTLLWARQVNGRHTVGFVTPENDSGGILTDAVLLQRTESTHEVEYLMRLLRPLLKVAKNKDVQIPVPRIYPDPVKTNALSQRMPASFAGQNKKIVGINISARKPSQQWPAANFIALINRLTSQYRCVLYWSPGANDASGHPGDDEKAYKILQACASDSLVGLPTATLNELICALDLQDIFITADGGAMHLAAALGKPVIALFGDSDPEQWRPWAVPQRIIHPASRDVRDISPEMACAQLTSLIEELDHA